MKKEKNKITFRELLELFINFLKKNKALKEYLTEFRKYNELEVKKNIMSNINPLFSDKFKDIFNKYNGFGIINVSFVWSSTQKGFEFWSRLNNEWNNIIEENKFKLINEKPNNNE